MPPATPGRLGGGAAEQKVEYDDREGRFEGEVAEVERQLDQRLAAQRSQTGRRADDVADDEIDRRGEDQPDDERDLAQRERVRLAPELEVNDVGLGEIEADGQRPPRESMIGATCSGI